MRIAELFSRLVPAIAPAGSYPSVIEVTSEASMRAQISQLKRGQYLVICFSASWCGACTAYKPEYEKLLSADRGRHRFLRATGRFTRKYARQYPDVYLVNWKGNMIPVGRYKILSALVKTENWKNVISDPHVMKFLNVSGTAVPGRTTWADMYALNRTIKWSWYYNNRLTSSQFWGIARKLDRLKGPSQCLAKNAHRFSPMIYTNDLCRKETNLIAKLKGLSRHQPVILYFTAKVSDPCTRTDTAIRDMSLRYPGIKIYVVDGTKKTSFVKTITAAAHVPHYPHAIIYDGGRETYRGLPFRLEETDAFQWAAGFPKLKKWINDRFALWRVAGNFKHLVKNGTSMADELLTLPADHPLAGVANRMLYAAAERLAQHPNRAKWLRLVNPMESYFRSFKSAKAMYNLASIAERETDIALNRKLDVLVPASGSHVATLVTAMVLMDRGVIDRADYTFTEIDPDVVRKTMRALQKWSKYRPELSPPEKLGVWWGHNGGDLHRIQLYWKGKPIRIHMFIKDSSPGKYFTMGYADLADIIILHDVGLYGTTPDDVTILPDVLADVLGDRLRDGTTLRYKRRILAINEFGANQNFISPFFANILQGHYGHGEPLSFGNPELRTNTSLYEVGTPSALGTWMSLSPNDQPLLAALRYRWEVDYLVDLGIAAYDSMRNSWKDKPIRFHIKKGDVHFEQIDALWYFGLSLHERLEKDSNAAKCLRYVMIRMLLNAFDECEHQINWAKGIVDSFRYDKIPAGFTRTLKELDLFITPGELAPPSWWKGMSKHIKRKIDSYLILRKRPRLREASSSN